ncbi:MAG: glutamyl-tRNA amidotransferase [Lachnospiraceae bacterium]|jgi:uncharacterized ubiquitin-like protein YukD|nr:glutamyl-tRNA amidotransferase [Lachnospiraceae bacterium]
MILVDIYVPSIGNTYDFQLDEEVPVGNVIEEISEMIGQKEHCRIVGDMTKLMLCAQKDRQILHRDDTLAQCHIVTGDSLLLV